MISTDIAGIALGQIKRKEMNLLLNSTQNNNGFAKVRLTMTRRVRQRNKHLPCLLTMASNIVFHRRVSPGEPFLLAKPVVNPLRRVTLFLGPLEVTQHPRINIIRETIQLRTANILRPTVTRWRRKRAHLINRSTCQAKITGDRALAATLFKVRATHLQINFHSVNPPALPVQTARTKSGRLLRRPHR